MKKKLLVIFTLFLISFSLFAKRTPPPEVDSLIINNYEYSADYRNSIFCGKGVLIKKDIKSGFKKSFIIYKVFYNPIKEKDVQFVFVKSMKLINEYIIEIENEDGNIYIFKINEEKIYPKSKKV